MAVDAPYRPGNSFLPPDAKPHLRRWLDSLPDYPPPVPWHRQWDVGYRIADVVTDVMLIAPLAGFALLIMAAISR